MSHVDMRNTKKKKNSSMQCNDDRWKKTDRQTDTQRRFFFFFVFFVFELRFFHVLVDYVSITILIFFSDTNHPSINRKSYLLKWQWKLLAKNLLVNKFNYKNRFEGKKIPEYPNRSIESNWSSWYYVLKRWLFFIEISHVHFFLSFFLSCFFYYFQCCLIFFLLHLVHV